MTTWYHCPLCANSKIHSEPDDLYTTHDEKGGLVYETPFGRAMRIEAVLARHMEQVHNLTPEQAVERLAAHNTGTEPK